MRRSGLAMLVLLALGACATRPAPSSVLDTYNQVPVRFMGMPSLADAATGGRTVVRLFSIDGTFWPVVEYVAEPNGGPVTVSIVNAPGNAGAARIHAPVDRAIWALALDDIDTLRAQTPRKGRGQTVTVELPAGVASGSVQADLVCLTSSWFVVADRRGASTPGLAGFDSCANRQGESLAGLYALALRSFSPCDALEPRDLDAASAARCLRFLGDRAVAVEFANDFLVLLAATGKEASDPALMAAYFGSEAKFSWPGGEAVGREAFQAAWAGLAPGKTLRSGVNSYQGLSPTMVEVRGEAFYGVDRDQSGRELAPADRELWFAPYYQVWVKREAGWTLRDFVVTAPMARAYGSDPVEAFIRRAQ